MVHTVAENGTYRLFFWISLVLISLVAVPVTAEEVVGPGNIQVLEEYPTEEIQDGSRSVEYFLLNKLQEFSFRVQGPCYVELLVRSFDTDNVSLVLGLDNLVAGERKIDASPDRPETLLCQIPPGTHVVVVVPMQRVKVHPAPATRKPLESERVVTWQIFAKREDRRSSTAVPKPPPATARPAERAAEKRAAVKPEKKAEPEAAEVNWARFPVEARPTWDEGRPSGFYLGAHAAGFFPVGTWADHLMAGKVSGGYRHPSDLDLFGPGIGVVAELGWKWRNRFSVGVQFDYTSVSTGEWEDYAEHMGSDVSADAKQWGLNLIFGTELFYVGPFRMEARFGLGYMSVEGQEKLNDYNLTFPYDFLQDSFELRLGLSANCLLIGGLEVAFLVDYGLGLRGVNHTTDFEDSYPYQAFTITLGIRLWPRLVVGGGK